MVKKKVDSKLTPAQALDIGLNMRKQGINYADIADHLKAAGYISVRTGRAPKEMAIRYMLTQHEKDDRDAEKEEAKAELADKPILLTSGKPSDSFNSSLQAVLSSNALPDSLKTRIALAMAKGDKDFIMSVVDIEKLLRDSTASGSARQ